MPEFDIVIKDGMIIDGTRAPRIRGDIGIKNGRIARIGRIAASDAKEVIDARGLIVAPGFIDLHTHYDAQLFWDPWLTISGWHGVTSVVIGNCGFGFAPVKPGDEERAMLTMTRTEAIPLAAMKAAMPWDWHTYPEFLDRIERLPKGVNVLPYVPVNPLMGYVMGIEQSKTGRMPTDDEHRMMAHLLNEAMDAGAYGWSAQRLKPDGPSAVQRDWDGSPMNTDVMHDETCKVFAKVLGERGEGFQEMTLASWNPKEDARHYEELAKISGRPIMFEAVQSQDRFPHRHRNMIRWLDRCRINGIPVYGQGITTEAGLTFTFEDWNLFDDSDSWREVTTGTVEERKAKLADPVAPSWAQDQPAARRTHHELLRSDRHHAGDRRQAAASRRDDAAQGGRARRQGSGRRDVRSGRGRQPQDRVLRPGDQSRSRTDERDHRLSLHHLRRLGRRRAYQVPHRRPLPDRRASRPSCASADG